MARFEWRSACKGKGKPNRRRTRQAGRDGDLRAGADVKRPLNVALSRRQLPWHLSSLPAGPANQVPLRTHCPHTHRTNAVRRYFSPTMTTTQLNPTSQPVATSAEGALTAELLATLRGVYQMNAADRACHNAVTNTDTNSLALNPPRKRMGREMTRLPSFILRRTKSSLRRSATPRSRSITNMSAGRSPSSSASTTIRTTSWTATTASTARATSSATSACISSTSTPRR